MVTGVPRVWDGVYCTTSRERFNEILLCGAIVLNLCLAKGESSTRAQAGLERAHCLFA